MKQIVILSGKGGTGKTSVTAAWAHLLAESKTRAVLVDADVDAANLELVLAPQVLEKHTFQDSRVAMIDPDACTDCGLCAQLCRFDAIDQQNGLYVVDSIACEGCALCFYQCPAEAVQMKAQVDGYWFRSESRYGPLFHAALLPAQENSGKLVSQVKQRGRLWAQEQGYDVLLVDGPPGIGCPVIAAAAGADLIVVVTEPTVAGIHDMERALATAAHFGIPALLCINKADLAQGVAEIEDYGQQQAVPIVARLPFDTAVTEAMVQGQPITAYQPENSISQALRAAWQEIMSLLE